MGARHQAPSPWYAKWVVLACAFCMYVLIDGVRFSFGVLYVELLSTFKAGKGETAWIGSILIGVYNLGGVIAGSIARKIGIMKTIVLGTLLSSIGLFMSSYATSIYIMYVTFGIIPGLGFTMMALSCVLAVSQAFEDRRSLAMGVIQAGGSIGGFIFNPLLQYFIGKYGWKGSLWLMSALVFHGTLFGFIIYTMRQKRKTYVIKETIGKEVDSEIITPMISKDMFYMDSFGSMTLEIDQPKDRKFSCNNISERLAKRSSERLAKRSDISLQEKFILQSCMENHVHSNGVGNFRDIREDNTMDSGNSVIPDTAKHIETDLEESIPDSRTKHVKETNRCLTVINSIFPYKVLYDRRLCIFLASAFLRSYGFFTPFVLLPDLAVEKQINIEDAAWLASAMGIFGAISRVLLGWIADFRHVDRMYLYIFCLLGAGVSSAVSTSFQLYGLLMVYACVFGILMGGECSLTPVLCADVAGEDKLAESYGMLQTLCGIGATCGTPLSGWLFEVTGGYSVSFILSGTLIALSSILLLPLKCEKFSNK